MAKEIWFTASKSGTDRTLYATTLDGKLRTIARLPGALMLLDVAKDGKVLLVRASWRRELMGFGDGRQTARTFVAGLHLSRRIFRLTARRCCSMKRAAADRSPIRSRADTPTASIFARPTARQPCCWVKAMRSLCLPMANGRSPKPGFALRSLNLLPTGAGQSKT